MRKEWLKSLKVGDSVYIAKTRNHNEQTATVAKIGRIWITVSMGYGERRFNRKTGQSENYYCGSIWSDHITYFNALKRAKRIACVFDAMQPSYGAIRSEIADAITDAELVILEGLLRTWGINVNAI